MKFDIAYIDNILDIITNLLIILYCKIILKVVKISENHTYSLKATQKIEKLISMLIILM